MPCECLVNADYLQSIHWQVCDGMAGLCCFITIGRAIEDSHTSATICCAGEFTNPHSLADHLLVYYGLALCLIWVYCSGGRILLDSIRSRYLGIMVS